MADRVETAQRPDSRSGARATTKRPRRDSSCGGDRPAPDDAKKHVLRGFFACLRWLFGGGYSPVALAPAARSLPRKLHLKVVRKGFAECSSCSY
jgi:hypothetical protein